MGKLNLTVHEHGAAGAPDVTPAYKPPTNIKIVCAYGQTILQYKHDSVRNN
jgi:hypothetical protein